MVIFTISQWKNKHTLEKNEVELCCSSMVKALRHSTKVVKFVVKKMYTKTASTKNFLTRACLRI